MSQALTPSNQTDLRKYFCIPLIWCKSKDEVDDQKLPRKIMPLGTWVMWQ